MASIAEEWNFNNLNIYNKFSNYDNYICVKYEDLLEKPKEVLSDVLKLFDLSFEQKMLEYYIKDVNPFHEPKETLAWKEKTLSALDITNIGKYKTELKESDIDIFNHLAGDSLKLFGYET